MSGFASLNQVNAARNAAPKTSGGGMAGTTANGSATFGQVPNMPQPQVVQNTHQPPLGASYTIGKGMMNTGRTDAGINMVRQNAPDAHGVITGAPMPSAVPQQAPANFDPNDPRNAALAGYMNG